MSIEDLDDQIGDKSSKNKYLTWVIIGIIIIAAIAVPMILLRQSEPAEATEPTTIEEIRTEVQTLWDTVYGINGLETKIALHAESIADFEVGDCTCPDYSGQFQNINNDLILLRTDLNAVPDYVSNITQVNTDLTALSADLTAAEATLLELQAQVDAIEVTDWTSEITTLSSELETLQAQVDGIAVTDWTSAISGLETRLDIVEAEITTLNTQIDNLDTALTTAIDALADAIAPRYAMVTSIGNPFLKVEVSGAGDYPVIITLYDIDAQLAKGVVTVYENTYEVKDEFLYNGFRILTVVIGPVVGESWGDTNEVNLVINTLPGSISYASASVGA